jgi:hypothetical protein
MLLFPGIAASIFECERIGTLYWVTEVCFDLGQDEPALPCAAASVLIQVNAATPNDE